MGFRAVILCLLVMLASGCVTSHHAQRGTNRVTVGEIPASKVLVYIGGSVDESLLIQADENGNATIIAGRGLIEMIPVYLSPAGITEIDSGLSKMVEWGEISLKNNIETSKYLKSFSVSSGFADGSVVISLTFVSSRDGMGWAANLGLCQIRSQAEMMFGPLPNYTTNPCKRELSIYLQPESVVKLRKILAQIPDYSAKATSSKSKRDLLK